MATPSSEVAPGETKHCPRNADRRRSISSGDDAPEVAARDALGASRTKRVHASGHGDLFDVTGKISSMDRMADLVVNERVLADREPARIPAAMAPFAASAM
jgi:hypothetical protein